MIRINLIGILALLLFACAIVCGWPVWIALAQLAWNYPAARWLLAGMLIGLVFPTVAGWNAAMRYKRQQAREKADDDYQRDKI